MKPTKIQSSISSPPGNSTSSSPSTCSCDKEHTCLEKLNFQYSREDQIKSYDYIKLIYPNSNLKDWVMEEWFRITNEGMRGLHLSSSGEILYTLYKAKLKKYQPLKPQPPLQQIPEDPLLLIFKIKIIILILLLSTGVWYLLYKFFM